MINLTILLFVNGTVRTIVFLIKAHIDDIQFCKAIIYCQNFKAQLCTTRLSFAWATVSPSRGSVPNDEWVLRMTAYELIKHIHKKFTHQIFT